MKNVKWLRKIEVVGSNYKGYWEQRGWSDDATVRTESRIDVVGDNFQVKVGQPSWVAGVAWAGARGISKVEVSTDDGGSWNEAQIKEPLSEFSWRLWAYQWTPESEGRTQVVCRATDGDGQVQTSDIAAPHPAGATGWHMVEVSVDA
jgi:hypothetical protein